MTTLELIRRDALKVLTPPRRLALSQWIESEMRLPAGVSALPGKVRLWPFQRAICDSIGDPLVERVSVVKPTRVGYSTMLAGAIGALILNDPSPAILIEPRDTDCRRVMVDELTPIFGATPCLRDALSDEAEGANNTLMHKRFRGGSLKSLAARSPANLRAHTTRAIFFDEIDAYEPTPEGNALVLGEERTLSYRNRKIVKGSTPVLEGGNILTAYEASDRRIYQVPCPECGSLSELQWQDMVWEAHQPDTAKWRCPHCHTPVDERFKGEMIAAGDWLITKPEVKGHHGYRLNQLVSPHHQASWSKLVEKWLAAQGNPELLQAFVNTSLAQGWSDGSDRLDEHDLMGRREDFGLQALPRDVLLLTCGVDVQDRWLAWTILGHSRNETFALAAGQIHGSYTSDETWIELDDLLRTRWQHPAGGTIGIDAAIVDSGDGDHQPAVYAFTRSRIGRRVVAGKGMAGFARAPLERSSAKGIALYIVGVDAIKNRIFNQLSSGTGMRFSRDLDAVYFEELTAERRTVRYIRGQQTRAFVALPGVRHEYLDSTVYALAARGLINADLDRREAELSTAAHPTPRAPLISRSKWMSR